MSPKADGAGGRPRRRATPPIVASLVARLTPLGDVKPRAMFGGYGFYLDGVFFAVSNRDRVYFKVDEETRGRYEAAGMAQFRPFDDHTVLHSYFEVPPDVLADSDAVQAWAAEAQRAAQRVSAKKPKRRGPRERR